jgi:hypothetical protein
MPVLVDAEAISLKALRLGLAGNEDNDEDGELKFDFDEPDKTSLFTFTTVWILLVSPVPVGIPFIFPSNAEVASRKPRLVSKISESNGIKLSSLLII